MNLYAHQQTQRISMHFNEHNTHTQIYNVYTHERRI